MSCFGSRSLLAKPAAAKSLVVLIRATLHRFIG